MRRYYYVFVLFLFLLIGCSKSNPETSTSFEISVQAEMPDFNYESTKAELDYVVRLYWKANDVLSVYNLSDGMTLCGELTAQSDGTPSTTFTGTISGVSSDDKLLLSYAKDLNVSSENGTLVYDFSNQSSTSYATSVPFLCTSVLDLSTITLSDSPVSVRPSFEFQFVYMLLAMADLPASETVDEVIVSGLPESLTLSYSSSNGLVATSSNASDGIISIKPSGMKTMATGARSVFLTFPNASAATRTVDVVLGTTEKVTYHASLTSSALKASNHYRTIVSAFTRTTPTEQSLTLSAVCPQVATDEYTRSWSAGDAISVVNLSTKEILGGTLTAQSAGESVSFSGNISSVKGVNGGDELLILYPALSGDDLVYDLSSQSGESLESAPYVMAGTMVVKNSLPLETVEMRCLTSVAGLSLNDLLATTPSVSLRASRMSTGASGEGYGTQGGSWGDDPVPYDYSISEVTLATVPAKLRFSFDDEKGYTYAVEDGEITLTHNVAITTESDDVKLYFSYPAPSVAKSFSATVELAYKLDVDDEPQSLTTSKSSTGTAVLPALAGTYTETSFSF